MTSMDLGAFSGLLFQDLISLHSTLGGFWPGYEEATRPLLQHFRITLLF